MHDSLFVFLSSVNLCRARLGTATSGRVQKKLRLVAFLASSAPAPTHARVPNVQSVGPLFSS